MLTLAKTIHVLALGLWFGTTVFFSFVVALTLFSTFEALTVKAEHRPFWLPAPVELVQGEQPLPPPSPWFPDPLTKEQGSRIAGAAVGPMFPWYFGVQVVCGVLALATAGGWYSIPGQKVHKVRMVVLALAVAAVAVGWWLEREVEALRVIRSKSSDAVLTISRPVPEDLIAAADKARADFGRWHGYSLLINFATLLLVTVGMALAAQLPSVAGKPDTALAPPPGENILRLGDASTPQPRVAGP